MTSQHTFWAFIACFQLRASVFRELVPLVLEILLAADAEGWHTHSISQLFHFVTFGAKTWHGYDGNIESLIIVSI